MDFTKHLQVGRYRISIDAYTIHGRFRFKLWIAYKENAHTYRILHRIEVHIA